MLFSSNRRRHRPQETGGQRLHPLPGRGCNRSTSVLLRVRPIFM